VNGTANFYFPGTAPATLSLGTAVRPLITQAVEKKLRFDPDYDHRSGYDVQFLGKPVPPPRVASARLQEILKEAGEPLILKYHHYSLVMNRDRRLQMWSAVNADYTPSKRRKTREEFGTDTWIADPRIAGKFQIEDAELYDPATKFDRGHIVRRDDTAWGDTEKEEILANSDSFHWTNCTPQHEQFNRDRFGFHGLWGGLENQVQSQAKDAGNKLSIFAGPILDNAHDIDHDFGGGPVKIPRRFWKIIFVVEKPDGGTSRLRAFGFILDQSQAIDKFGIERFSAGEFDTYQVALQEIAAQAGLEFDDVLHAADALNNVPDESRRIRLKTLDDVRM
jgi:endonuclease G